MSDENLQSVSSESEIQQPKLYTEQELNREIDRVVGRKKAETAEKVGRETAERVTRELEEKYRGQAAQSAPANVINEDAIVSKITSTLQQQFQERQNRDRDARIQEEMKRDASNYINHVGKINVAPEDDKSGFISDEGEYADLKLMIGRLNLENTPEILEEIARKPKKLNELSSAAERGKMKIVNGMLKEISDSIDERKNALDSRPNIKAPVTSLKPSTSSSSSRPKTLNDWKNMDWNSLSRR